MLSPTYSALNLQSKVSLRQISSGSFVTLPCEMLKYQCSREHRPNQRHDRRWPR